MPFTIPNEADAFNTNQAEPDSVDFGIIQAGLARDGVISGCAVTAQGTPDMTVAVAGGEVVVGGANATVTAGNVTITTADAAAARFDLIVSNSSGTLSAVAGAAGSNPVFPAIPASSVVLAAVYVPAADTTIASNQITDKRLLVLDSAAAGASAVADSAAEGTGVTFARSDHRHSREAFGGVGYPLDVAAVEADGTATTLPRSDHVHAHGSGYLADAHHAQAHGNADHTAAPFPSAITIGGASATGIHAGPARGDHEHGFSAPGAGYPLDVAAAEADGTATTPARSDHVHAHGSGYLVNAHHNQAHAAADHNAATLPSTFNETLNDDIRFLLGTGGPAGIQWETADANANYLQIQLPAGGVVDVPVIVIGEALDGVDLGLYNGIVNPLLALMSSGAVATASIWDFRKARGTLSAPTVITTGDDLGSIRAFGYSGAGGYVETARIEFDSTGTIATTRVPGLIRFSTGTDAAPTVLTTRLTINSAGLATFANSVQIDGTGNSLVVDTNVLVVDATNNRVGIGQATPLVTLGFADGGIINFISGNNKGLTLGVNSATNSDVLLAMQNSPSDFAQLSVFRPGGALNFGDFQYYTLGPTYATSGLFAASSVFMWSRSDFTAGIRIGAEAGPVIFFNGAGPTERMRLDAVGNAKLAGTATRATTEGTNHLDIFDGTAPVGTLANGISLYSTAGELRVMDSGGTATLLSPHDDDGYWVFDSVNTQNGRGLRIDVEKMLRRLNALYGWDFIKEFSDA